MGRDGPDVPADATGRRGGVGASSRVEVSLTRHDPERDLGEVEQRYVLEFYGGPHPVNGTIGHCAGRR